MTISTPSIQMSKFIIFVYYAGSGSGGNIIGAVQELHKVTVNMQEPLNNGHTWDTGFVLCKEVVLFWRLFCVECIYKRGTLRLSFVLFWSAVTVYY